MPVMAGKAQITGHPIWGVEGDILDITLFNLGLAFPTGIIDPHTIHLTAYMHQTIRMESQKYRSECQCGGIQVHPSRTDDKGQDKGLFFHIPNVLRKTRHIHVSLPRRSLRTCPNGHVRTTMDLPQELRQRCLWRCCIQQLFNTI